MIRKFLVSTVLLLAFTLAWNNTADAQWGLGVSYENRADEPTNGFGVQLEPTLISLALVDVRLRGHFSYFSEENELTTAGIEYTRDVSTFDYGAGAIGAVSLGMISPYVGVGLGSESWNADFEVETAGVDFEDIDDSSFYYYGVGGISLKALPVVDPYIEYRYSGFTEFEQEDIEDSDKRFLIGVTMRF